MKHISSPLYAYAMSIKLNHISSPISKVFPNAEDMLLSSRQFEKLDDAVSSVNALITNITDTLNLDALNSDTHKKYKMFSEISPRFSNTDTVSKQWDTNEIAKLWIYDASSSFSDKSGVMAIALAQLVQVQGDIVSIN